MKAIEALKEEHRVIERVLTAFEKGIEKYEKGDEFAIAFFQDVVAFFKGFADGCHHRKEEKVLFVSMNAYGIPIQGGPIGVMLEEHDMGRGLLRGVAQALEQYHAGDPEAKLALIKNGREYISLLRQHILKEDHILFPMADRVIPADQKGRVWTDFESIEHEETGEGIHEKYLQLAQKLESQV